MRILRDGYVLTKFDELFPTEMLGRYNSKEHAVIIISSHLRSFQTKLSIKKRIETKDMPSPKDPRVWSGTV